MTLLDTLSAAADVAIMASPPTSPRASSIHYSTDKICHDCGTEESVKWRFVRRRTIMKPTAHRDSRMTVDRRLRVCNACGLYWRKHGKVRPAQTRISTLLKALQ